MAWLDEAVRREIPPGSNDPEIIPIGVILHVDAGNAASLFDYFDGPSGGIESHFHAPKVGRPEQYRDTTREADANYEGNSFVRDGRRYGFISVETQGYEDGTWNANQLRWIKHILAECSRLHDFPLRVCPAWDEPGVGYHVMFGAPGPWTPASKTCPGPDRIDQFNDDIVPWMEHDGETGEAMSWDEDLSRGTSGTDITELADETLSNSAGRKAAQLLGYAAASFYRLYDTPWGAWLGRRIWNTVKLKSYVSGNSNSPGHTLRDTQRQTYDIEREVRTNGAKIDALADKLDGLAPGLEDAVRGAAASVAAEDVAERIEVVAKDDE